MVRAGSLVLLLIVPLPGQGPAPAPDPWSGFPLGAWVELIETREIGDQAPVITRVRHRIVTVGPGDARTVAAQELQPGGAMGPRTLVQHVPGRTPEQLGLRPVGTEPAQVQIGAETIPCSRSTYSGEGVTLELWRSPGLQVPYRELVVPGPDLGLPPDVLRARWRRDRGGERHIVEHLVEGRAVTRAAAGREWRCSTERRTVSVGSRSSLTGTVWLCDQVPGRVIASELTGATSGRSIHIARELQGLDLPAPEAFEPGRQVHPRWIGAPAGAWRLDRRLQLSPQQYLLRRVTERAAGVLGGLQVVERTTSRIDGAIETSRHLLETPLPLPPGLEPAGPARAEELAVGDRTLACQVQEHTAPAGATGVTRYAIWTCPDVQLPVREGAAGCSLATHTVRVDWTTTQLDGGRTEVVEHSRRALDLAQETPVGGETVTCLLEEETWSRRRTDASPESGIARYLSAVTVPGQLVATCRIEGTGADVRRAELQLLAWGQDAAPTLSEQQPAPPLPAVVAPERRLVPHPWAGARPGTWVRSRREVSSGGEAPRAEEQLELVLAQDHLGAPDLLTLAAADGLRRPAALQRYETATTPGSGNLQLDSVEDRQLEVEGQPVDGRESVFLLPVGPGTRIRWQLWEAPGLALPYREASFLGARYALGPTVVRTRLTLEDPSGQVEVEHRVLELHHGLELAGEQLECIIEERRTHSTYATASFDELATVWVHALVPGGIVRSRAAGTSNGVPYTAVFTVLAHGEGETLPLPAVPGLSPWSGWQPEAWVRTRSPRGGTATRQLRGRLAGLGVIRTTTRDLRLGTPWRRELDRPGFTPEEYGFARLGEEREDRWQPPVGEARPSRQHRYQLEAGGGAASTVVRVEEVTDLSLPVRFVDLEQWRFRLDPTVVRFEVQHRTAQGLQRLDRQVLDAGTIVQAGDQEVPAVLEQVTSQAPHRAAITSRLWTSPAVPGGLVRRVTRLPRRGLAAATETVHTVEAFAGIR
jgi:hypothetical protein